MLFTIGWGPGYFADHTDGPPPVPRATAMSSFETPTIDDFDVCIHAVADDNGRLADLEDALRGDGGPLAETIPSLDGALSWRETRTGFMGPGIPAAHQDTGGIPSSHPVAADAPLFMGFTSGFRKNQATEDDVTIESGPLAGGTTMHVSRMRLRLDSWYQLLDDDQRAHRMFAPQTSASEVAKIGNDADPHVDQIDASADQGVVGHLQASAQARRNDRPIILRRDFNTVDDGQAGLHFVCLQRDIDDFVATREAMNAANATERNPAVGPRVNNGIKEFMFVTHRANYLIPPRSQRSFPLLASRDDALT